MAAIIPLPPHHAMRLANAVGYAFPGLPDRGAPLASVVVMVATRGPARPPQGRGLGGLKPWSLNVARRATHALWVRPSACIVALIGPASAHPRK